MIKFDRLRICLLFVIFFINGTRNTLGAEQNPNSAPKSITYVTTDFWEKVITGQDLNDSTIIFDRTKIDGMRVHGAGRILYDSDYNFWYDSDTLLRYIDYANYNIILVTQEIDTVEYVRDYLVIEKRTLETSLTHCQGTVRIDGVYPKFDVTVVVNHSWRGKRFTDDISQAFKVNMETRKIEPIIFETIRLYSEI